jgi:uncharacterized coiled-coil protein SlyX
LNDPGKATCRPKVLRDKRLATKLARLSFQDIAVKGINQAVAGQTDNGRAFS